jgi:hypothetical protein
MANAPDGTVIKMPDGSMRVKRGAEWLPTGKLYSGPGPKLETAEAKQLSEARLRAEAAEGTINDQARFSALNRKTGTGGQYAIPLGVGNLFAGAAGVFNPELREMNSITERLTPTQRAVGSGPMSDADVNMYRKSVIGPGNEGNTNRAIGARMKAGATRERDYAAFLDYYAKVNGTLNGAQEAWDGYKTSNPIYDPETATVRKTQPWRAYFGLPETSGTAPAPRAPTNPARKAPPQNDLRKMSDDQVRKMLGY